MDGDLFVELGKILARKHKERRGRFAWLAVLKELYPVRQHMPTMMYSRQRSRGGFPSSWTTPPRSIEP